MRRDAHFGVLRLFLGVPGEIHLGGIFARGEGNLLEIRLDRFPAGFPLFPVLVAGLRRDDGLRRQRCIVPVLGRGIRRRGRTECEQDISGDAFLALAELHSLEDLLHAQILGIHKTCFYPTMGFGCACYAFVNSMLFRKSRAVRRDGCLGVRLPPDGFMLY